MLSSVCWLSLRTHTGFRVSVNVCDLIALGAVTAPEAVLCIEASHAAAFGRHKDAHLAAELGWPSKVVGTLNIAARTLNCEL